MTDVSSGEGQENEGSNQSAGSCHPDNVRGVQYDDLYLANHLDVARSPHFSAWSSAAHRISVPGPPQLTATQLGLLPANAELTDRVELRPTRVRAGRPIQGTLLIMNHSSHPINLTMSCEPDWAIVLASTKVMQYPAFATVCSRGALLIGPGLNRYPVTVHTTYLGCANGPQSGPAGLPECVANMAPGLPPGTYYAILFGSGNLPLPEPSPVAVRLSAD
jgi:hypothetical protein